MRDRQAEVRRRLKQYNKWRAENKTQHEIAQLWGITRNGVKMFVTRAQRHGLQVDDRPGMTRVKQPKGKRVVSEQFRIPHGGGTQGRKDCKCDLCVQARRDYANAKYRREHPEPYDRFVPHGGGAAGRKGCKCEPCTTVRRAYNADKSKLYKARKKQEKASVAQSG